MDDKYAIFEKYLKEINQLTQKYQDMTNLIENEEILPANINRVMGEWFWMNTEAIKEYKRKQIEQKHLKFEFDQWYDEKFIIVKEELTKKLNPNGNVTFKLSLKEIEVQLRFDHSIKYYEWQEQLIIKESSISHYRRLIENLKYNSKMLDSISNNMRQEMSSLHVGRTFSKKTFPEKRKVRDIS